MVDLLVVLVPVDGLVRVFRLTVVVLPELPELLFITVVDLLEVPV